MTASMNEVERKESSLKDRNKLLQKTNQKLKRKYGHQTSIKKKTVGKLNKSVHTRFVDMAMCISRVISKRFFKRYI